MNDLDDRIDRFAARQPDLRADPFGLFADLQADDRPAIWSEALAAWMVTRRQEVLDVVRDTGTWSNRSASGAARTSSLAGKIMELAGEPEMAEMLQRQMSPERRATVLLAADPPDHQRQRRALNDAFHPKRIEALEPEVQALSDRLVAEFARRGRAELVSEYTILLPMTVIARALGVPEAQLMTFKKWSDDIAIPIGNANPSVDQVREFVRSQDAFQEYFTAALLEREGNPSGDLISDVANAEVDGEPLSLAERLSALSQFLVAGNETSTTLLTNIARHLATNPELRDEVAADRSLVPKLVEEALRFEAPVQGLFRQANHDTAVGDIEIPQDGLVWVAYAAANRDPDGCPFPHDMQLDRERNIHLSFGHGEHYCIGAGLARLEAVIGTNALLDLPNLRVADGFEPSYADSFILRGITSLEVQFDPAG
jgi:cytochrome P450